jgi:hypothetical protein
MLRSRIVAKFAIAFATAFTAACLYGQNPEQNVNMVSGTSPPDGDPFLQRQNEPSIAVSTRNSLHLLAGANDYRTVDLPGLPSGEPTGDAWLGLFRSRDGGLTWRSTLIPGYPQDQSPLGASSPLKGFQAGADPAVRAGTNRLFYYSGLVLNRGTGGASRIFVARFIDDNNREDADTIRYLSTSVVADGNRCHPWTSLRWPWTSRVPEPRPARYGRRRVEIRRSRAAQ